MIEKYKVIKPGRFINILDGFDFCLGISPYASNQTNINIRLIYLPPASRRGNHDKNSPAMALFALKGNFHVRYGEELALEVKLQEGCYFFIPPEMGFLCINTSDVSVAILAAYKKL